MNERERVFLIACVALVVMIVGLFVFNGVSSAFKSRDDDIYRLSRDIKKKERRIQMAKRERQRLLEFQRRSLPSDAAVAHNQFQEWLFGMAEWHFPADSVLLQSAGERVLPNKARQFSFTMTADGKLDELTQFLHRVYSANSLQRVAGLTVTRQGESRVLKLQFLFQGLAIPGADETQNSDEKIKAAKLVTRTLLAAKSDGSNDEDLGLSANKMWLDTAAADAYHRAEASIGRLGVSAAAAAPMQFVGSPGAANMVANLIAGNLCVDAIYAQPALRLSYADHRLFDYQDVILRRNLFGLANRPPSLASPRPPTAITNRPFSFTLQASDPDEFDELEFALQGQIPAGATLQQTGSRSARLQWTPTKPGTYDFSLQIADSGWPIESIERRFSIRVEDPRIVVTPPKPVFDVTAHTVLTAILRGTDGRSTVWLHERPTNVMHKKFEGDEFKIGAAKVVVKQIRSNDATFEVNGEAREINRGDRLNGGKAPRVSSVPRPPRTEPRRDNPRTNGQDSPRTTERKTMEVTPELQKKYSTIDSRYLKYYVGLFSKSDADGSGKLEKSEWAEMKTNPKAADVDKDEIVSLHEFISWKAATQ